MENEVNINKEDNLARKEKIRRIAGIVLIIFSIVVVGLVVYFTLREDMPASWGAFFEVLPNFFTNWYLLAALGGILVVVFMSALNFRILIHSQNGRRYRKDSVRTHLIGRYYDHITPFGSGGQPYQIYHLRKLNLNGGQATSITFLNFAASRFAFATLSVIFIVSVRHLQIETWVRIVSYIGLTIGGLLPGTIMLLTTSKKITRQMLKAAYWLINKLPFKNKEAMKIKSMQFLRNYHMSMNDLKGNMGLIAIIYINHLINHLALASIAYFVLKAVPAQYLQPDFGGQALNFGNVVTLSFYTTNFTNVWPTPGGAGGAELSFGRLFGTYVSGSYLTWAMFIWRFFTFYSYIIIGFILVVTSAANVKKGADAPKVKQDRLISYQFIDNYYPSVDGVVKVVNAYATHLKDFNIETKVVAPAYKAADDSKLPYEVLRTPSIKFWFSDYEVSKRRMSLKFQKQFDEHHPAILHAHSPFIVGHKAIRLAQKYRIPLIGTFHTQFHHDFQNATKSKILTKLALRYVVNFYKACDEVWAVSAFAADVLRSYGYQGPIKVMPNGIDMNLIEDVSDNLEKIKNKYGIKDDEKNLLYTGNLLWQKNVKVVIDAYVKLKKQDPSYRLIMVGGGRNQHQVKNYATKIGIYDEIIFTGSIDNSRDIQTLYELADLFFFPSLYETYSLVFREAAAKGTASLVAEGGVCAEVITDGVNGYVAEADAEVMYEKIIEIFADETELKKVGQQAKIDIPTPWESVLVNVSEQYERLAHDFYEQLATKIE